MEGYTDLDWQQAPATELEWSCRQTALHMADALYFYAMQVVYGHYAMQAVYGHPDDSSHHDDGTPGTAVLVEVHNIGALHAELHTRGYPFLNPGIGSGPGNVREMQLIDPASNRIRFYEPARAG